MFDVALATQMSSPPVIAPGPPPTGMVRTTLFLVGSIRDTVASPVFVTQTAPAATVTPPGSVPTAMLSVRSVAGSIRDTVPAPLLVTQTESAPTVIADGAD